MHFADEIMATMVMNASGGTQEKVEETMDGLREAVSAFMRFANQVQDEFFMRTRAT